MPTTFRTGELRIQIPEQPEATREVPGQVPQSVEGVFARRSDHSDVGQARGFKIQAEAKDALKLISRK